MSSLVIKQKRRPKLAMIIYAVMLAVLTLPICIVVWFRAMEPTSGHMAPAEIEALVFALALTLAVAYVLTRAIAAPIRALICLTKEIAVGGRAVIQPLQSYGTHEIATLSQSFLDLAGQLVDRTEYVRSFAAHVSHELKSPLTAIKGAAELLLDENGAVPMTKQQRDRFLSSIVAEADRLDRLLLRLRELAHAELPATKGQTTMAEIVADLAPRFQGIEIVYLGDDMQKLLALPLEAATISIGNLIHNAAEHRTTRMEIVTVADDRNVTMTIRDNGTGIPAGNRDLIFTPFFSTRREQGGTGMGLDIARAMLAAHGGTIRLADNQGDGAAFELTLPIER